MRIREIGEDIETRLQLVETKVDTLDEKIDKYFEQMFANIMNTNKVNFKNTNQILNWVWKLVVTIAAGGLGIKEFFF